jgi:cellulose synthase/poly-beta-1,6-N-acetylglucosamine synthase-like glycosyltransferase
MAQDSISTPPMRTSLQPGVNSRNGVNRWSEFNLRSSNTAYSGKDDSQYDEKHKVIATAIEKEERGPDAFDPEKDGMAPPKRPFLLVHALLVGLAMILAVVVEMACVAKMITEVRLDGNMSRFALLAIVPVFATFSLFFMIVITGSLFQIFGPLSGVQSNSRFYSAKAPKPERYPDLELPHITIQMPVYKEGLKGVIIPTITSLVAAVKFYESKGGTASIYVNDDGMQLVKPDLAEARKAFYELNQIGWCSRPPHCTTEAENYFLRKGQFKKASNMNYCLDFSIRVEDETHRLIEETCRERGCTQDDLTIDEENELYENARNTIVEKDGGKTQAAGDVRIGEIILLIDSDIRVPEDCLLFGALEMHESPEVALLQHASGILQVVNNVFENGISYFTNLVYTSIQFAVGNGDAAPFVGHNTFIRWKAIQSIAWEEDDMTKFWSDSHVSEDFDVSLRLQMNNFVVRLATYHNGGFKEGVSLTVYDELARWEKYAYGCNELVFNPLYRWPYKGPFTRLFIRFIFSNIKITSKITIFAYIGTYYAVASAIPLTLVNYLIVGWFQDAIDQFYLTSWRIFVGMAVV